MIFWYYCKRNGFPNFSSVSLFVYRNATDFWALCLYPATLLNCSIPSKFGSGFSWFFHIEYHDICEERHFDFFFANLDTIYRFSCLIAVARTSSTTLNNNGESGQKIWTDTFPMKTYKLLTDTSKNVQNH